MNSIDQYNKLTNLVNENLSSQNITQIVFEKYENIKYTIFDFPYEELVNIEDNSQFLHEAYYKILDRIIDSGNYSALLFELENGKTTKEKIIEKLSKSNERAIKKTALNYGTKRSHK